MTGGISIRKNGRETLLLALNDYVGNRLVNLRVWFDPSDGGPLRPGRDGFTLKIAMLPELIAGLVEIDRQARSIGWLPPTAPGAQCEECGQGFDPNRADARFCSAKCRAKASRTRRADSVSETNATLPDPTFLPPDLGER